MVAGAQAALWHALHGTRAIEQWQGPLLSGKRETEWQTREKYGRRARESQARYGVANARGRGKREKPYPAGHHIGRATHLTV